MKFAKTIVSGLVVAGLAIAGYNHLFVNNPVYEQEKISAENLKRFVYCIGRSASTLSPALGSDGTSYNSSSRIIFNRLFENKRGSIELEPALATDIETTDAVVYTLHLRQGVKFNDNDIFTPTRDFNADDVLFTFNRMLHEDHPYNKVSNGKYPFWNAMNLGQIIKSVEKVDDYTVKFTLNERNVTFKSNLALDVLSIYSQEYADFLMQRGTPELIDQKPIGTGPWKLDQVIPDTSIRYLVNKNYFRGASPLDEVVFSITPDSNSRIAKLITGACDFIDRPNTADLSTIVKKYNLQPVYQTGLNVAYLALNNEDPILKDPRVRRALDMAVSKDEIARLVYNNEVVTDNHLLTEQHLGYNPQEKGNAYNIEMAKQLLAEAGYPNGFDIEIFVQPVSRSSNPSPSRTAEIVQQDWKKIGVNVTLRTTEYQEFLAQTRAGNFQVGTYGWSGDNGDTDNFLGPLLSSRSIGKSNYSRFNNAEFDNLVNLGRQEPDEAKREEIYRRAEKIFLDQQPVIILGHAQLLALMSPKVIDYQQTPFGYTELYGVDIKK